MCIYSTYVRRTIPYAVWSTIVGISKLSNGKCTWNTVICSSLRMPMMQKVTEDKRFSVVAIMTFKAKAFLGDFWRHVLTRLTTSSRLMEMPKTSKNIWLNKRVMLTFPVHFSPRNTAFRRIMGQWAWPTMTPEIIIATTPATWADVTGRMLGFPVFSPVHPPPERPAKWRVPTRSPGWSAGAPKNKELGTSQRSTRPASYLKGNILVLPKVSKSCTIDLHVMSRCAFRECLDIIN